MEISGIVEDVIYYNTENGYTVINLDYNGELLTCVGKIGTVNEGECIALSGEFVKNSKYGKQFSVHKAQISKPNTLDGLVRYLSSGLIKGVGPVTAQAIVDKFKLDTLSVIEMNPKLLSQVRGVSEAKAEAIAESYNEVKAMQDSLMFLQNYNISTNMALKIIGIYQSKTKEIVSSNPYRLIDDIDGIGFLTADKIARSIGIDFGSEFRVVAGITHVLKVASEKGGNTCLPYDMVLDEAAKLLGIESFEAVFQSTVESMVLKGTIKSFMNKGEHILMLSKFYFAEQSIAKKINLLNAHDKDYEEDIDEDIKRFEELNKIKLHEDQIKAVKMAVESNVSIITGGPGTGKTTIVKCVIEILKKRITDSKKLYLIAPTGRAAKRLSQSCGTEASTIHRALEVGYNNGDKSYFVYNDRNKLPAGVVIVDEMSMVDSLLMNSLTQALPDGCKLILIGDKDQLPSVGAGNVLHDMIESEVVDTVCLTQIYRQDDKSLIVQNAHLVNSGHMPDLSNKSVDFFFEERKNTEDIMNTVIDLTTNRLPNYLGVDPTQIQVLAPMRSGVCGVDNLNRRLQEIVNPESLRKRQITLEVNTYREGDKVMQITNNYQLEWSRDAGGYVEKGVGVFNGDVGVITQITETGEIHVKFEDDKEVIYPRGEIFELNIAYATTIHKSQGSEFDVVVMPMVAGSNQILTRNLLYTGITRAKKMVVLVGTKQNIFRMVSNNYTAKRYSMLDTFLRKQKSNTELLFG